MLIRMNDAGSSQRRCASGKAPFEQVAKRVCVHLQAELEDQVQISTSFEDLCDQNVIVYLLRTKSKEYMPQVLQPVRPASRVVWTKSFALSMWPMMLMMFHCFVQC